MFEPALDPGAFRPSLDDEPTLSPPFDCRPNLDEDPTLDNPDLSPVADSPFLKVELSPVLAVT